MVSEGLEGPFPKEEQMRRRKISHRRYAKQVRRSSGHNRLNSRPSPMRGGFRL